ncbi:MAG TPA: hypothetical protein DDW52_20965 [Planctomycetaceae bacterium]|nr:hypothetical protein [Planctomycetaceae bacterium]
MRNVAPRAFWLIILSCSLFGTSRAEFITFPGLVRQPILIDFDDVPTLEQFSGPLQIGNSVGEDVTFFGSPNTGLYTNFPTWGLDSNGRWGNGRTFVSSNDARPGGLVFEFRDGPVLSVGAFINYAPNNGSDLFVEAFDSNLNLLERHNVTQLADIVTPGELNGGAFRGIVRDNADISFFFVRGYVPAADDLRFSRTSVPEPSLFVFWGICFCRLAVSRRR